MKWGGMALVCLILFSCLTGGNNTLDDNGRDVTIVNSLDNNDNTSDNTATKNLKAEEQLLPSFDIEPDPDKDRRISNIIMDKDDDVAVLVKNKSAKNKAGSSDKSSTAKNNNMKKTTTNNKTSNSKKVATKKTVLKPVTSKKYGQTPVKTFRVKEQSKPYNIKQIEPKELELIEEEIHDKNFDLSKLDRINVEENTPKESTVNENDEIIISLDRPGWIIKNISDDIIKLLNRENLKDSTSFKFRSIDPGETEITFLRYDPERNDVILQTYRIVVKPDNIFATDKQKSDNKNTTDDFRKTVADNLYNQGKYTDAKARYNELLKDGKDAADIYYKLGMIEKNLGNDAAALENFEKNIKEKDNPYFGEALAEMIRILKKLKKYQDAINAFYTYGMSEAIPKRSQEELYLLLADVYYGMNDFVNSAKEYRRFINIFPLSISLDKALFYLAYSMENYTINPDFKGAYALYKLLMSKYPESKYYSLSKNRMLYLERHYLKVN